MADTNLINPERMANGQRACAVPTKCHTPRGRSFEEMMSSNWEEFVIRFDAGAGQYVTWTACCPGAPVCC